MILGIDPGVDGAIAILTHAGELVDVIDMPALADGAKGRRAVNAALIAVAGMRKGGNCGQ